MSAAPAGRQQVDREIDVGGMPVRSNACPIVAPIESDVIAIGAVPPHVGRGSPAHRVI